MVFEQSSVTYDQFMPQPRERRLHIFNQVSPENRAELVQAHIKRWLAANCHRLSAEQVSLVAEIILFITPDKYQAGRDMEQIHQEIEALRKRAEAVLACEDVIQVMSDRAEYVSPV